MWNENTWTQINNAYIRLKISPRTHEFSTLDTYLLTSPYQIRWFNIHFRLPLSLVLSYSIPLPFISSVWWLYLYWVYVNVYLPTQFYNIYIATFLVVNIYKYYMHYMYSVHCEKCWFWKETIKVMKMKLILKTFKLRKGSWNILKFSLNLGIHLVLIRRRPFCELYVCLLSLNDHTFHSVIDSRYKYLNS